MVKFLVAGALCVALALPAAADESANAGASFVQAIWESVLSLLPEELQPTGMLDGASTSGEVPADEMLPSFVPNG